MTLTEINQRLYQIQAQCDTDSNATDLRVWMIAEQLIELRILPGEGLELVELARDESLELHTDPSRLSELREFLESL